VLIKEKNRSFSELKQDFLMKSSAKKIRFRRSSILNAYLKKATAHLE